MSARAPIAPAPAPTQAPTPGLATLPDGSLATTRYTPYRGARERAYIAWATGEGLQDSGHRFTMPPRASLAALLAAIPPDVRAVYLVSTLPGMASEKDNSGGALNAFLAWAMSDPGPDWQNDRDRLGGSYYHRIAPESTVLRLRRRDCDRQIDIRPFACWGTDGVDPAIARAGLKLLEVCLHDGEHGGWYGQEIGLSSAIVLASPAVTGERLWQACMSPGVVWPILPDDLRELLHATSGQHRIETFPAPGSGGESAILPDGLYGLDARFAYADALYGLGYGPAEHDLVPALAPARSGWYRVTARVPDDWSHVGILPLQGERRGDGWTWPSEPGRSFKTWAGTAELCLALWPFPHICPRCAAGWQHITRPGLRRPCSLHGWGIQVHERILFQTSDAPRGAHHPLDVLGTRLRIVYDRLGSMPPSPAVTVAQKAVRAILLDTIGMFHRGARRRTYSAPLGSPAVPLGRPLEVVTLADGEDVALWEVREPAPADAMSHPEWSTQVYSRVRARILIGWQGTGRGGVVVTGLVTLPREHIAVVRGDALYLTANPHWPDHGRPGALRVKEHRPGPLSWPDSLGQLKTVQGDSHEF